MYSTAMEEIKYVGEHLLPGQIGQTLILLGFFTSILAAIAYYFSTQAAQKDLDTNTSWRNIGRVSFGLHGISVFGIIGVLFYVMINRYYEYAYVHDHVSDDLPFRYIFSAFWEGQEGSFLLWMFWHVVLGGILIFTAKKWESPVLSVLSVVQLFLMSMILGQYFGAGDVKIGANPLLLTRDIFDAPVFARADYLSLLQGQGLNPLLQNYWMTIHPPTLFLGFASTVVPFCYAIAGLWTNDFKGWLKPVLPWSLFSAFILGIGILMGGAWAYEALTFGGYWAWDPVENASLVPWLILVAGVHTAVIAKNTGYSIRGSMLFLMLCFIFIVYSTFLTRSGILGDTSVHAFTEMGLEWQLVIFLGFLTIPPLGILIRKWNKIPSPQKEETAYSREFWMFIGSLVLIFSSVLITFTTSIPVFNKIALFFDPGFNEIAPPTEPIPHYNKYQVWIAVLVGLFSGMSQFLRYKGRNWDNYKKTFTKHIAIAAGVSVLLTILAGLWININAWQYWLLTWASIFGIVSNLDYLISVLKGNILISGSAVSHIGFGIMIIGILASGLNKEVISRGFMQTGLIDGFGSDEEQSNLLLYKGLPTTMGEYRLTYLEDSVQGNERFFIIDCDRMNDKGDVIEEFTLYPTAVYDNQNTEIVSLNPSTKHYLHKDIFTHITALPEVDTDRKLAQAREDSLKYERYEVLDGETIITKDHKIRLERIDNAVSNRDYKPEEGDEIEVYHLDAQKIEGDTSYKAEVILVTRGNEQFVVYDEISALGLKFKIPDVHVRQEEGLNYQNITVKEGETFTINGQQVLLKGFNRDINNDFYEAKEGDIAVAAILEAKGENGELLTAQPIYVIRDRQPMNLPDEMRALGLKFRFLTVNPQSKEFTFLVADNLPKKEKLIFDMASNVPRSDYVVMRAILFPGINFFWLGSVMMMCGFLVSLVNRKRNQA